MDQNPFFGTMAPFPFMPGMPMIIAPSPFFSPFSMPMGPFSGPMVPIFDPVSLTMGAAGIGKQELDQMQRAVLENQKQQLTQLKKYVAEYAKSIDQAMVKIDEEIGKMDKPSSDKREKHA